MIEIKISFQKFHVVELKTMDVKRQKDDIFAYLVEIFPVDNIFLVKFLRNTQEIDKK